MDRKQAASRVGVEHRVSRLVIVVLVLAGLATGARAFREMIHEAKRVTAHTRATVYGQLPQFSLLRETGAHIKLSDLIGKIWVADFIFTRCAGPCPVMTQSMAGLHNLLSGMDNVRFITFSVDPEYDTVEVLSRYAASFGADPNRWAFLTGSRGAIVDLALHGFKLAVAEQIDGDDGHRFIHSTKFVLIDEHGRIRGYYDGVDPQDVTRLATDITTMIGRGDR